MKKKLIRIALVAIVAVAIAIVLGFRQTASAHTAVLSASCEGVVVDATNFDADETNRWSVTINGETQSGTFGAEFYKVFPVLKGGQTTSWSGWVEDEQGVYVFENSGVVGPCGEVPEHKKAVAKTRVVDGCDRNDLMWWTKKKNVQNLKIKKTVLKKKTRWVATAVAERGARFKDGSISFREVKYTTNRGKCGGS
jgi:hypothetical protein